MIGSFFEILGSLGMFLFGMKVMSEALQKLSGDRLRSLMRTMTSNRFAGVATGFLVTCLVQSSSASTVMMVSFVNAGLLKVVEAIGVIMGANLGTTTTFWIVSFLGFKFSLSKIALPIIGVAMPFLFARKSNLRDTGEFLIGFGLLFLGLVFLKEAVPDIKNNPEALAFIQSYTDRGLISVLFFFAFGTILTVIVQSSSVAGAITITMAAKGWIDFPTAAAIILGENVGTTITANLAALSANANAKRAALAHFFFNIIGVIWAILLFVPLTRLADYIVPGNALEPSNIPFHMAAFHTGFNLLNIALVIGFVPHLARLVERLIKDRPKNRNEHMKFDSSVIPKTGELNLAEAHGQPGGPQRQRQRQTRRPRSLFLQYHWGDLGHPAIRSAHALGRLHRAGKCPGAFEHSLPHGCLSYRLQSAQHRVGHRICASSGQVGGTLDQGSA